MSQFKVGPAKFRHGGGCEILDICTDGTLIGKRNWDEVGWVSMHRYENGYAHLHGTSCDDILPNVEPEWREYVLVRYDESITHDSVQQAIYDRQPYDTGERIIHYRYAPGRPIQIISGDFVDAREKDDT